MGNDSLGNARKIKNDEFYTQFPTIQKEINAYLEYKSDLFNNKTILLPCDDPECSNFTKFFAQNFERFGLKKLISTSYAIESKGLDIPPTEYETQDPQFDIDKTKIKGKMFVLDRDTNGNGKIDIGDLTWEYMDGDGDFRSNEVKKLRDQADFIITNPPFSLFRDFISWLFETDINFLIIGNMNAISYNEVFPLIKNNKMWLGATGYNSDMVFGVPQGAKVSDSDREKAARLGYVGNYTRMGNSCWFTNMEHGRRHQPIQLMTIADNLKFNKKIIKKFEECNSKTYPKYDNYNAIEVPFVNAIPSDYKEPMAVPVSFLDKYNPEQFEILNANDYRLNDSVPIKKHGLIKDKESCVNGISKYVRILIKNKQPIGEE